MESTDKLIQNCELTPEEQNAWNNLANELIFAEQAEAQLSRESATEISQKIQTQFVEIQENKRREMMSKVSSAFKDEGFPFESANADLGMITDKMRELPPKEFLKQFTPFLNIESMESGYYGWGFTPKLASTENGGIKANCLGQAILLGTYCKKMGIKVEMGITPDHPFVVATIDEKKYAIGTSELKDLTEGLQEKDGYSIYKPNGNTKRDDNQIIVIHDFDQAVLHEILENFAVLSKVADKEFAYLLPGSKSEGEKIAKEHKGTLLATDWQTLQNKLFPEIQKSFEEVNDEWSKEIDRIKNLRARQYKAKILNGAFRGGFKLTSQKQEPFEAIFPELFNQSRLYKEQIISYLRNGTPLSKDVPRDIVVIFEFVKQTIDKEDIEAQKNLYSNIASNLNIDNTDRDGSLV